MLANYLLLRWRYYRSKPVISLLYLFLYSVAGFGLLIFTGAFINGFPLISIWKYLVIPVLVFMIISYAMEVRLIRDNSKELLLRKIHGARPSDIFLRLGLENMIMLVVGSLISLIILDFYPTIISGGEFPFIVSMARSYYSLLGVLILSPAISLLISIFPAISSTQFTNNYFARKSM